MKKLVPFAVFISLFAACTKDPGSPVTPPETHTSVVTSVSLYDTAAHTLRIDSFEYDLNSRLKTFYVISYDSSTVPAYTGSSKFVFSYNGNDSLPVSITSGADLHILEYNDHKQIIKDSVYNLYTYYFNYGDNVLYTTMALSPAIGTYQDTITLQNGNMVSSHYWFFMPNNTSHSISSLAYSSSPNPLHNLNNLGLLMYCLGGKNRDYISTNLFSSLTVNSNMVENNTWISSEGQVTGGTESFGAHNILVTFRYK